MDWYVFLILLLLSLPILRAYGDSMGSYIIALAWVLAVVAADLDHRFTSFFLSYTVWAPAIIFLIGVRHRRWAGLTGERSVLDWGVLFALYAAGVGAFSLLVPSPGYLADYSNEQIVIYGVVGMGIIGVLPLLGFWGYSRLVGYERDRTPEITE